MDPADKQALLTLARETIAAQLGGRALPELPALASEPAELGGVFVTLHNERRLRGCIGRFNPDGGLAETVQAMAVATLGDPRFRHSPVASPELPELRIEVSVLSKMRRTTDPASLEPGVHGVYIRRGGHSGCFLPQVATELGWDRETFLSRCCADKAGLPPDAWKYPDTEVHLFTSEAFEEK
ncbi:MAG: AmmeMemoRadiSam system protein A [Planctomycetes bacterium]|nr:AmmeMemoRadiSam system protein A [Planctomycetota bacterium]